MIRLSAMAALAIIVFGSLGISGCSDNPLAPFQPEITSATDNFQLQATGVTHRTVTLNYEWNNTGTQANVSHSTTTTSGSARLIILDAGNNTVYDQLLVPSREDTSNTAPSGTWKIRLVLNDYSGTLNFRVQKR